MKTYWDHTERERAALDYDQVRDLLKFELMEKGIVDPATPQLLDESTPDVPTRKFYRVTHAKGEYGAREQFPVVFETPEQAEAFMSLKPGVSRKNWNYPGEFFERTSGLQMEVVELPTEQDHLTHRPALANAEANKKANSTAKAEHEKACREMDDALESIWGDYRSQQAQDRTHRRLIEVWERYVADCDGDEEIAMRFLRKAYSEDQIGGAFAWCEREQPGAFAAAEITAENF